MKTRLKYISLAGRLLALVALLFAALSAPAARAKENCDHSQPLSPALHGALFQAHQLYEKGEYQKALAELESGKIGTGSAHYRLFFMRGLLNYQLHRLAEAEKNLARAVELKPCFFQAAYNLASIQYEQNRFSAAALSALRAFEMSRPPDWEILYLAGAAFLEADRPELAEPHLVRLARLAEVGQAKPEWHRALIRSLMEQHKQARAKTEINRFLARWPGRADMWRLLANLETLARRYAQAAAALEVAMDLDDGQEGDRLNLAQLFRAAGAPLKAAQHYQTLYGPRPGPEELEKLARLKYEGRSFSQARRLLLKSINREPTFKRYRLLAEICLQIRDYRAAREAFLLAAQHRGGRPAGRDRIWAAQCSLRLGDYVLAELDYSQALSLAKGDESLIREAKEGLKMARQLVAYWRESK